ncbi:hypothetical protein HCN44_000423 [Aphidius gifuensis]|uniref:Uncharacterized protein n=1 Tax=Aphidius gifuensis TaxID=684658 RepID=A0A835CQW1_APHGI|nr:hypothetical protein HCN44_000423 [Aphidius gifuensis]
MLSAKPTRSPQSIEITSKPSSLKPLKKTKSTVKKKMQLNPSDKLNETNDLISEDLDSMSDDDVFNRLSLSDSSVVNQSIEDDNENKTISNSTLDFNFNDPTINEYFNSINTSDWDRSYGLAVEADKISRYMMRLQCSLDLHDMDGLDQSLRIDRQWKKIRVCGRKLSVLSKSSMRTSNIR